MASGFLIKVISKVELHPLSEYVILPQRVRWFDRCSQPCQELLSTAGSVHSGGELGKTDAGDGSWGATTPGHPLDLLRSTVGIGFRTAYSTLLPSTLKTTMSMCLFNTKTTFVIILMGTVPVQKFKTTRIFP